MVVIRTTLIKLMENKELRFKYNKIVEVHTEVFMTSKIKLNQHLFSVSKGSKDSEQRYSSISVRHLPENFRKDQLRTLYVVLISLVNYELSDQIIFL